MIIYFVGDRNSDIKELVSMGVKNILISYPLALEGIDVREVKSWGIEKIFIDSGSYTANGMTVEEQDAFLPVDDYIEFLKQYDDCIEAAACLDRRHDFEYTYKKWKYMVGKGCRCIPVFQGNAYTNLSVMDEYLKYGDYIALSGSMKRKGGTEEDSLFAHKKLMMQYPNVKFHGFGLTFEGAIRGNYYSVDSSSWMVARRYGYVLYYNPFRKEIEGVDVGRVMYWKDSPMEFRKLLGYYPEWAEKYDIKSIKDLNSPKKAVTVLIETLFKPLCKDIGQYEINFRDE